MDQHRPGEHNPGASRQAEHNHIERGPEWQGSATELEGESSERARDARSAAAPNHAYEALRRSEDWLQFAQASAGAGIWDWDVVTGELQWSEELFRLFDFEPQATASFDSWRSLLHPDDRQLAEQRIEEAIANHAPLSSEYRVVLQSGDVRWISALGRTTYDRNGKPQRMSGICLDVTERKRAEQTLRRSEARLKLLSSTAGRLLAVEDPQSVVREVCHQVLEHLDCHIFLNYLVDEDAQKLRLNAYTGIADHEARGIEWLDDRTTICGCVARDQHEIVAENIYRSADRRVDLVRSHGIQAYCCHPLMAEGRLIGTLSFGTRTRASFRLDEVELLRTVADQVATAMQRLLARRALSLANRQLLEADRRKNEFLAVLSHELRNPLAPIVNCLSILDRAPPGKEQAQWARKVIGRQVKQLSDLVNDLLDVTRIARDKAHLHTEPLELCSVVHHAVEDNRPTFQQASVRLDLEPAPGPVPVIADATRIAQIVGNLLRNCAKFTPRGGHARVSVFSAGNEAIIRVTDDGIGMTEETLRGLFQPFMQADRTLHRTQGGLGVGLSLVKALVELHGGSVSAHSEGLGRGSEIEVRLPLGEAPSAETVKDREHVARSPRRVLIIEDNADAGESLRQALELSGHTVHVASSGPEGLRLARALLPEVVLCDIGLPGMDGFDVARALRDDQRLKSAFMIALTGYALPRDLVRASEAGFDVHLAKPPNLETLDRLLADMHRADSETGS